MGLRESQHKLAIVNKAPKSTKRLGHIPGAIRLEWKELIINADDTEVVRVFRPIKEIKEIFTNTRVTKDKKLLLPTVNLQSVPLSLLSLWNYLDFLMFWFMMGR